MPTATDGNLRLVRKYLTHLRDEKGHEAATLYSYMRMFQRLMDHLNKPLGQADIDELRKFIGAPIMKAAGRRSENPGVKGAKPTANTRKNRSVYIRNLYKFLHEEGLIKDNPAERLSVPEVHAGEPNVVNDEDWKLLWFSDLEDCDRVGYGMAFFFGLREFEAVKVRKHHFRPSPPRLVGFGRKGGSKVKGVPWLSCIRMFTKHAPELIGDEAEFMDPLNRLLGRYPEVPILSDWRPIKVRKRKYQRPDDVIDPTRFNRRLERSLLDVPGLSAGCITPHALRGGFATHMHDFGVKIKGVKELMGHSSIVTTERYIAVKDDPLEGLVESDGLAEFSLWPS